MGETVIVYDRESFGSICAAAMVYQKVTRENGSAHLFCGPSSAFPWPLLKLEDATKVVLLDRLLMPFAEQMGRLTEEALVTLLTVKRFLANIFEECHGSLLKWEVWDTEVWVGVCRKAWLRYVSRSIDPPRAVDLLDGYELGERGPDVMDFQYGLLGMGETALLPSNGMWADLLDPNNDLAATLRSKGEVYRCWENSRASLVMDRGYKIVWKGFRWLVLNTTLLHNQHVHILSKVRGDLDGLVTYSMESDGQWLVRLYSADDFPNCVKLAKLAGDGAGTFNHASFKTRLIAPFLPPAALDGGGY